MEIFMRKITNKDVETGVDYILPDYMGDVKKILFTSAKVLPSAAFHGSSEAEFSGVVEYDIYYSDAEGVLTKASAVSDYDFRIPTNDENCVGVYADVKAQSYSVRVTGPRKFSTKAVLTAETSVSEKKDYMPAGNVFEGENRYESVSRVIKEENVLHGVGEEREYAEEVLNLEETDKDAIEILAASGNVKITENEAVEGGVKVKGEMILTVIISTDSQPPFAIRKIIPFEETVTVEGATPGMKTASEGFLSSVNASSVESGEGASVTVNAILELAANALSNNEITVIKDAYLENKDTETEYKNLEYTEFFGMSCTNEAVLSEAKREGLGVDNITDVLIAKTELRGVNKKAVKGGLEISGEALVSAVACETDEEGKISYSPLKFASPFNMTVNLNCQIPDGACFDCKLLPVDTEITIDAENIYAKTTVAVCVRVYGEKSERCLKSCVASDGEEYVKSSSKISVYYPEENESLFSVAKRFHTTSARIAADNKLTVETVSADDESTLNGVKKLIIR